jgi:hypothetical protein
MEKPEARPPPPPPRAAQVLGAARGLGVILLREEGGWRGFYLPRPPHQPAPRRPGRRRRPLLLLLRGLPQRTLLPPARVVPCVACPCVVSLCADGVLMVVFCSVAGARWKAVAAAQAHAVRRSGRHHVHHPHLPARYPSPAPCGGVQLRHGSPRACRVSCRVSCGVCDDAR